MRLRSQYRTVYNAWSEQEVLRRENQGLKVYPVEGS